VREESLIVIEAGPDGRPRRRSPLAGRRLLAVALLALAEVVALAVWRPGVLLGSLIAVAILALAVAGLSRTRPGLWRDVLIGVAGAQGVIVLVPALLAASLFLAVVVGVLLLVAILFVLLAPRAGRG
jgi:hypothetical protein